MLPSVKGLLACWLLLAHSLAAQADVLDGTLGQWLERSAAPKLVETLGQHPRFKGETLRIVALDADRREGAGNALTDAIGRDLTHALLRQSQTRVLWRQRDAACERPGREPLLLALELSSRRSGQARLRLAVIDPEENSWVPGINLKWQGQLSRAQRQALKTPTASANLQQTYDLTDSDPIAEAVTAALECRLPRGIDGSLAIDGGETRNMQSIAEAVRRKLAQRTTIVFAESNETADWHLTFELVAPSDASDASHAALPSQLRAVLREQALGREQWLAQLPVTPGNGSTTTLRPDAVAMAPGTSSASEPPQSPAEPVLPASSFSMAPLTLATLEACTTTPDLRCATVETETTASSYLFAFQTRSGQLEGRFCSDRLKLRPPGRKRYRVRLEALDSVALHLLAVTDPSLARQVRKQLRAAPGQCDGGRRQHRGSYRGWLKGLDQLLAGRESEYRWQHLKLGDDSSPQVAMQQTTEVP